MNSYAIFTFQGMIILRAKDIADAKRKFRRNHQETLKSIRLIRARDTVAKTDLSFLSYRSDIGTSKMWITKEFEIVPLPGMYHRDFLLNSENRANFRIGIPNSILEATIQEPEEDTPIRLYALKQGFTRVNYQFNGGKITFETHEMIQRMDRKRLLVAVGQIMEINRKLIDAFHFHVLDDAGIAVEQYHLPAQEFEAWRLDPDS